MRPTSRAQRPPALTTCSARTVPCSVTTFQVPSGLLGQLDHAVAQHDRRAELLRRLGVGVGGAGRVEMPLDRVPERADEVASRPSAGTSPSPRTGVMISVSMPRQRPLAWVSRRKSIRSGRVGHHHAAGQVQPAGLARELLELAVERRRCRPGASRRSGRRSGCGSRPPRARTSREVSSERSISIDVGPAGLAPGGRAPSSRPRRRRSPRPAPAPACHSVRDQRRRPAPEPGSRQPVDHVEMVAPAARSSATCRRRAPSRCWRSASVWRTNSGRSSSPTQTCTRAPVARRQQRRALRRRLGRVEPQVGVQRQPQQRPQVVEPADRHHPLDPRRAPPPAAGCRRRPAAPRDARRPNARRAAPARAPRPPPRRPPRRSSR